MAIKEFGISPMCVRERVARIPRILVSSGLRNPLGRVFCLRVDADEYTPGSFERYYGLFKKYHQAISIFFCIDSFSRAPEAIESAYATGIDVQSHGFYHHVYNDYRSNRYNIQKAKSFLASMGITTRGFVGPMGKFTPSLMRALEDEGYEYSSDFFYDYLGVPHYPLMGGRKCGVLQIPVFPVAPELFFEELNFVLADIRSYYLAAIKEMLCCNLPVIIYAHTSQKFLQVPGLLEELLDFAITQEGLKPMTMTQISRAWKEAKKDSGAVVRVPAAQFLGKETREPLSLQTKQLVKGLIDFERVTPDHELRSPLGVRFLKRLSRRIIHSG